MRHCNEFELDSLLKGQLDRLRRFTCFLHLAICSPCRTRYRQARNNEKFIVLLRESVVLMDNADFDAQRMEKSFSIDTTYKEMESL